MAGCRRVLVSAAAVRECGMKAARYNELPMGRLSMHSAGKR